MSIEIDRVGRLSFDSGLKSERFWAPGRAGGERWLEDDGAMPLPRAHGRLKTDAAAARAAPAVLADAPCAAAWGSTEPLLPGTIEVSFGGWLQTMSADACDEATRIRELRAWSASLQPHFGAPHDGGPRCDPRLLSSREAVPSGSPVSPPRDGYCWDGATAIDAESGLRGGGLLASRLQSCGSWSQRSLDTPRWGGD